MREVRHGYPYNDAADRPRLTSPPPGACRKNGDGSRGFPSLERVQALRADVARASIRAHQRAVTAQRL